MSEPISMKPVSDIAMDKANLYREEVITDLRVGSIQVFTPVKTDGSPDPARKPLFSGEAQIMGPSGPLPIRTKIEAASLDEALEKFPAAIDQAVKEVVEQIRELQRQEMSRIVTPGEVASSLLGGGGGGRPSKIVLK
ncbi:MAG: hypothetical protein RBU30_25840 [Polyangia bacterium]|nr:hypothetical protein [Polyangia bacterium]